jgi:hypothetical protein
LSKITFYNKLSIDLCKVFTQHNVFLKKIKKIMNRTTFQFALFSLFTLTALFSSCSKDELANPIQSKATIMAIHASPDAPGVDILVDNAIIKSALVYPQNTPYVSLDAGSRNIKVNVAGSSNSVINATLNLVSGKNYSLFAVDSVSKISSVLLQDDLTTPATGKAHVRFVHLSPNAPAVDIAVTGGAVVFPNIAFKGSTAFAPLTAGTYQLEVRLANTSNVVLLLPNVVLGNGKIYTVFAKGFVGGTGVNALDASFIINN